MSRRSLFILLALPTMVVLIAWPVSYYKQYSRRNRTATTAFVRSVDVTSVAVFRGDLHLFFQRSGPDQPPFVNNMRPSSLIVAERQFTFGGLSLKVRNVIAGTPTPWTPGTPVKTYRQAWVCVPLHMLALLLIVPLAVVLVRGPMRRGRRRRRGLCVQCAYDLRGNTSGVCPECAAKVEGRMPRSRTRRIAKWVGLVVCVVIFAAWLFTLYGFATYQTSTVTVGLSEGGVFILPAEILILSPGWTVGSNTYDPLLWHTPPGFRPVFVPLRIALLIIAIPTAWFWWRDRRHPGYCQRCGYNLTGNVTGVCSECAEPTSTEKTQ